MASNGVAENGLGVQASFRSKMKYLGDRRGTVPSWRTCSRHNWLWPSGEIERLQFTLLSVVDSTNILLFFGSTEERYVRIIGRIGSLKRL